MIDHAGAPLVQSNVEVEQNCQQMPGLPGRPFKPPEPFDAGALMGDQLRHPIRVIPAVTGAA